MQDADKILHVENCNLSKILLVLLSQIFSALRISQ